MLALFRFYMFPSPQFIAALYFVAHSLKYNIMKYKLWFHISVLLNHSLWHVMLQLQLARLPLIVALPPILTSLRIISS